MIEICQINPDSKKEIGLVSKRMRQTLIEVIGENEGQSMYSLDWLKERLLWHLHPDREAAVYLSKSQDKITGHAIVRVENVNEELSYGHFSTIYIEPKSRKKGIATALIKKVENWCLEKQLPAIIYNTAEDNFKLIELFENLGFIIVETPS